MTFSFAGPGGIEGDDRRDDDGEEVARSVMRVSLQDAQKMDQSVGEQEPGSGDGRRPLVDAPDPGG